MALSMMASWMASLLSVGPTPSSWLPPSAPSTEAATSAASASLCALAASPLERDGDGEVAFVALFPEPDFPVGDSGVED
eukprot:307176-Rhodomonas_salina.1